MIPKPKKMTEKEKHEHRGFYPPFIAEKIIELNEHPEINNLPNTKITDFYPLYADIWVISNKNYQERFWVRQELPMRGDNYGETTLTFFGDVTGVLEANNPPDDPPIKMTLKQREMLQKLYDMVFEYDTDESNPESRYGENDEAIVNDPKWQKIGEYAKLVYEELSGDDLDAWEKQR